ncbi:MAG: BACON domain-containing protein [Haliscomenobacter sp.]|nr:BACON domain-containing protein [Haliscomenobacter sp.]
MDSNPKDSHAQAQLEKCNSALNPVVTLSVSKGNLSFPASGGSENITVSTNKSPYSVNLLPSWCTLQKYSGYFINCSANAGTNIRNGYFMVAAGDKTIRINISQSGKEEIKTETALSVSKGNLSFPSGGGSENITVVTNKGSYSINLLPAWCSVKKYSGYFIISCSANSSVNVRNDFFS